MDLIRDFIESIGAIDSIDEDLEAQVVDNALAIWFADKKRFPEGVHFKFEHRDTLVQMFKDARKWAELVMTDEFMNYIDGVLAGMYKSTSNKLYVLRFAFLLGYALRSSQDKPPKE